MSLATSIDPTVTETILDRLTPLFLKGAAEPAPARQAAISMLDAFKPETPEELALAADIVSFRMHSLEALSQAALPEMPLRMILRLRGGAVSLNREAHRSQGKLDQVQRDRRTDAPALPAAAAETTATETTAAANRPSVEKAVELIEFARDAIDAASKGKGQSWTKAYNQRLAAQRLADRARRTRDRQLEEIARANANAAAPPEMAQAV